MTLPISTLDREYGFGNLATLADAVISRLIGLGHLDESNPRLVAAYQEIAFNRLRITANDFYTDLYYADEIADELSDQDFNDFAGDFTLLDSRVETLFTE